MDPLTRIIRKRAEHLVELEDRRIIRTVEESSRGTTCLRGTSGTQSDLDGSRQARIRRNEHEIARRLVDLVSSYEEEL